VIKSPHLVPPGQVGLRLACMHARGSVACAQRNGLKHKYRPSLAAGSPMVVLDRGVRHRTQGLTGSCNRNHMCDARDAPAMRHCDAQEHQTGPSPKKDICSSPAPAHSARTSAINNTAAFIVRGALGGVSAGLKWSVRRCARAAPGWVRVKRWILHGDIAR
jgi:hypothetical protein